MGNQTTIIIRNDAIGDIRANPAEFVKNLFEAMNATFYESKGVDVPCGSHANVARVIECHHSDSTTIIASGGSTGELLATIHEWRWPTKEEMLGTCIEALTVAKAEAQRDGS